MRRVSKLPPSRSIDKRVLDAREVVAKRRAAGAERGQAKAMQYRTEALATGAPPPAPMPPPTADNTRGYRRQWLEYLHEMRSRVDERADDAIIAADRADFIVWERSKFAAGETDAQRLQQLRYWIWYMDDYNGPSGDDRPFDAFSRDCAGCDMMDQSWSDYTRTEYPDGEPRWRLEGTCLFFCHFCRERVEDGKPATIAMPAHT